MKMKIKVEKEVELKILIVKADVRYWEDARVNGVDDTEGDLIPCRQGDLWCPIIDIDTGIITNWKKGVKADVHYMVSDCCGYEIQDENGDVVFSAKDGYVPKTLSPKKAGYGDYIIMDIDENGKIDKWKFNYLDFYNEH